MADVGQNQSNDDKDQKTQPSQNQDTTTGNTQDAIAKTFYGTGVPDKRQFNPLSKFASVNYQLSLYMLTPQAFDVFMASGRQNLDAFRSAATVNSTEGVFLIAQTGGINNQSEARADGFDLDFYIDNVILTTVTPVAGTQSTAGTFNVKMTIIEPYGFSLISSLKAASEQVKQAGDSDGPNNPVKNLFVLGIRFLGYDINGRLITGQENIGGQTLDPFASGDSGGIFERYLDFRIHNFSFNLDGKAVKYNIDGTVISSDAYKLKRGMIDVTTPVQGDTVENMLKGANGLEQALNAYQQTLLEQGKIEVPTKYEFEFTPGSEEIAQAPLVDDSSNNPYLYNINGSGAKNTIEATDKAGFYASIVPTVKRQSFAAQTRISEAVETIIKYSAYMTAGLKELYDNLPEPNEYTGDWVYLSSGQKAYISWFTLNSEFANPVWDKIQQDWIFNIKYKIQKYETPYTLSPYAKPGRYYGPHKRYSYWFTGDNTEVLRYEQQFNNAYFLNVVAAPGNENSNTTVKVGGAPTDEVRAGDITGRSSEPVNNYINTIFDPGSQVSATLEIMGDPDYLGPPYSSSINDLFNKFYGADGFTISGSGGQVFIEIDFNEARDYDENSGLLQINDQISFYTNPWNKNAQTRYIKGLVYQVRQVEHRFIAGKFTQVLSLVYVDPSSLGLTDDFNDAGRGEEITANADTTPTADGKPAGGTGLRTDSVPDLINAATTLPSATGPNAPGQSLRGPNGNRGNPTADDDYVPGGFTGTTYTGGNYYDGGRDDVGLGNNNPFGRPGIIPGGGP